MHDAHLRVLLRVTGPAYEFRHTRLQEWLARRRSDQPGAASFTGSRPSWAAAHAAGQARGPWKR
ncbi:hypothetical protein [Streptomyces sp. NRRL B-3648]|uniref:hypothetical protein n=1 Tax=Streptomyces sp. NRRL B-3648 TaxID=1519493 RepID=UPI0006C6B54F|nr:hypothetical protein [Streptomyces sp. NRRL B-3648]KOX11533.1 hypothetical protein ADL04_01230 [Streptomyces sp. NRRL B-3648]